MKWVKLRTSLHNNFTFRRISAGTRLVFYVALEVAGDLEQGGALFTRGAGPLTVAEIATAAAITEPQAKKALNTLVDFEFLSIRDDGAYIVEKWAEKTDPEDPNAADRQRRKRERDKRVTSRVASRVKIERDNHGIIEKEEEKEVDSPDGEVTRLVPKPCRCVDPSDFDDSCLVEDVAEHYLERFVNCRSVAAKSRNRAKAVGILRELKTNGHSWDAIFAACAQVHADGGHAPIWNSGPIWTALRSKPAARANEFSESLLAAMEAQGQI